MPLLYEDLVRLLAGSAANSESAYRSARADAFLEKEKAELLYKRQQLSKVEQAQVYLLDVRQAEHFKAAEFGFESFPPMPHRSMWVEFNGTLRFDYVPLMVEHTTFGEDFAPEVVRVSDKSQCNYRGVLIYEMEPPHLWFNLPKERVVRAFWYETPAERVTEKEVWEEMDSFSVTLAPSVWPRMLHEEHYSSLALKGTEPAGMAELAGEPRSEGAPDEVKEAARRTLDSLSPEEAASIGQRTLLHARRLQRMTVNLLYFLSAENVVRVRIAPHHHARHGKDLAGLPKSRHPYYVLPFQLPRYRYLHRSDGGGSGRKVSVRFEVRGHFRHLKSEHYERNHDGSVRVVWVRPHERGVDNPRWSKTRVGTIDGLFLDYDRFIRQEEAAQRQRGRHGGDASKI